MTLSRSLLVVLLVCILMTYFPSPSYLHCASLFSSYLHCAVIFLFSPSLFTLRCYLPLLSFFIALLSLSLQCDSKKEASDTGNIQQEEEDDAHTRNEDDAQVRRLENNMYDVWTEAVLIVQHSTEAVLIVQHGRLDRSRVQHSRLRSTSTTEVLQKLCLL